ncbi:hypothetical protein PMIN01_09838 [Paraphaeosphaeria minitans]|uniref:Uncharacterized protein n=1 Tax=Paraphaeosphaeria minitans TaxID=565426 RepID=A0A9P6GAP0_9PLEO|nr:hypothetical protein PMIN01_09838 [Paraphaeosphaeria minitans]
MQVRIFSLRTTLMICGNCICSTRSGRLIAHSTMRVYQYGVPSQAQNPKSMHRHIPANTGKHAQLRGVLKMSQSLQNHYSPR